MLSLFYPVVLGCLLAVATAIKLLPTTLWGAPQLAIAVSHPGAAVSAFGELRDTVTLAGHSSGVLVHSHLSHAPIYLHKNNGTFGYKLNLQPNDLARVRQARSQRHQRLAPFGVFAAHRAIPWELLDPEHEQWEHRQLAQAAWLSGSAQSLQYLVTLRELVKYASQVVSEPPTGRTSWQPVAGTPHRVAAIADQIFERLTVATVGGVLDQLSGSERLALAQLTQQYLDKVYGSLASETKQWLLKWGASNYQRRVINQCCSKQPGCVASLLPVLASPEAIQSVIGQLKLQAQTGGSTDFSDAARRLLELRKLFCLAGGWKLIHRGESLAISWPLIRHFALLRHSRAAAQKFSRIHAAQPLGQAAGELFAEQVLTTKAQEVSARAAVEGFPVYQ